MNLETSVELNQDNEAARKTFDGKEAVRYSLTGSVSVQRPSGGRSGRGGFPGGGRFPGRGRFPGGGFPGGGYFQGGYPGAGDSDGSGPRGGSGRYGRGAPSVEIEGEYWMADAPRLGTRTKNALLPSYVATIPPGPFVSLLSDRLARTKHFPMASRVTMTTTNRRTDSTATVTVTTEAKSITEGPLDASLFKLPDDYKKVDAQPVSVSGTERDTAR
jgi:hypothetical protein